MSPKIERLIRKGGDPILSTPCVPCQPGRHTDLLDRLVKVCKKAKNACGLAAPQLGVAAQAIYLYCRDDRGTVRGTLMLNPEVLSWGLVTDVDEEGCLSYPGQHKAIRRPTTVQVRYCDRLNVPHEEELVGFRARVFGHEYDHLQGCCKVGDPAYLPDAEPGELLEDTRADAGQVRPSLTELSRHGAMTAVAAMRGLCGMTGLDRLLVRPERND